MLRRDCELPQNEKNVCIFVAGKLVNMDPKSDHTPMRHNPLLSLPLSEGDMDSSGPEYFLKNPLFLTAVDASDENISSSVGYYN